MDEKKLKNKLEASMAKVRKTAVEVEAALHAADERKTAEAVSHRKKHREEATQTLSGNIQNKAAETKAELSGEVGSTDGSSPRTTREQTTPPQPKMPKTYEELLKNGTPEEKAFCIINEFDLRRFMGEKAQLTKKQKQALFDSIETAEERKIFRFYIQLYSDLGTISEKLSYVFKQYQIEVALLANLLTEWDMIDKQAALITLMFQEEQEKKQPKSPEAFLKMLNANVGRSGIVYILDEGRIVADINQDNGLYAQIQQQAEEVTERLQVVKGYIDAIEDYLLEHGYYLFMPSQMDNIITNVREERFLRHTITNPIYLRSELNHKKIDKGEPVTDEEEYKAVAADYMEIERDEEAYNYTAEGIKYIRNGKDLKEKD